MKVLAVLSLLTLVSCSSVKHQSTPATVAEVAPTAASEFAADEAAADEYDRVPANECDRSKYRSCREARRNDVADRYMLGNDGTLFRRINGATCSITSGVQDFKISQHPNDVAVIYFKKNNDLHLLNMDRERRPNGQCPSSAGNIRKLMENVKKYTVTSNQNTTIVNAALDESGNFRAWDNTRVVYSDRSVEDFQMNQCFGTAGKSFSSYVLFTRDSSDNITKVRVSNGLFTRDESNVVRQRHESIRSFVEQQRVCQ